MADDPMWMEHAAERMKAKHTTGSFGKATEKHIAAAKKKGGVEKKKAVFAEVAKKVNAKRFGGK